MIFQQIHVGTNVDVEREKEIEGVDEITDVNNINNTKKRKDITAIGGVNKQFRLLEAHGITMIPVDNESSIVENAMESGRTVVLTGIKYFNEIYILLFIFIDIGYLFIFTEAGKLALNLTRNSSIGMKRLHVAGKKGTPRKVIAIRADQILSQNTPTLTSRGPNILKRSSVDNKAGKLFISSISTTTPVSTLTQSKNIISSSEV